MQCNQRRKQLEIFKFRLLTASLESNTAVAVFARTTGPRGSGLPRIVAVVDRYPTVVESGRKKKCVTSRLCRENVRASHEADPEGHRGGPAGMKSFAAAHYYVLYTRTTRTRVRTGTLCDAVRRRLRRPVVVVVVVCSTRPIDWKGNPADRTRPGRRVVVVHTTTRLHAEYDLPFPRGAHFRISCRRRRRGRSSHYDDMCVSPPTADDTRTVITVKSNN